MVYFAVIEKNTEYSSYLVQKCKTNLAGRMIEFQTYHSYEEFIKDDFYLHDVQVVFSHISSASDIDWAKKLKTRFPSMEFIFYSSDLEMVPLAYEVEHLFFILQSQMDDMLAKALKRAVNCVQETEEDEQGIHDFLADRIFFMQDIGDHRLRIVTEDREYMVYMTLNDIMSIFKDHSFIKAENGYFIQSMYISNMDSERVTFVDGSSLYVHCCINRSLMN